MFMTSLAAILLSAALGFTADTPSPPAAPALVPTLTRENGLSCGRTKEHTSGVSCSMPGCYATSMAEFQNWAAFEEGFLKAEFDRKGFSSLVADFSDACPAYTQFSAEEKKLVWLDFLKLMAAFESDFAYLTAYDDWTDGKVDTGRGFFSIGVSNCPGLVQETGEFCKLHDPKLNTSCALDIILTKLRRAPGKKVLEALSGHWGSLKPTAANGVGGRREKLLDAFGKHPACKDHSVPFDRLKQGMLPDADWNRAKIQPSYAPSLPNACSLDQSVTRNERQCQRQKNWDHYRSVDARTRAPAENPEETPAETGNSAQ